MAELTILDVSSDDIDIEGGQIAVQGARSRIVDTGDNAWSCRHELVHSLSINAIVRYALGDFKGVQSRAEEALGWAEEHYFGEWRRRARQSECCEDPYGWWVPEFRFGALWAGLLAHWDRARRLAEFVQDDIEPEIEQKPEDRAWLQAMAAWLRGEPWESVERFRSAAEKGKRERMLFRVVEGIANSDELDTQSSFTEYWRYFSTRERKKIDRDCKVAIEGSFLYHYARETGFEISVPESIAPRVFPMLVDER
jgi:hypothetical protein